MQNSENYTKINFLLVIRKTDQLLEWMNVERPNINQLEHRLQRALEGKLQEKMKEYYDDFKGRLIITEAIGDRIEGQYHTHCYVRRKHEQDCMDFLKEELTKISGTEAEVRVNLNCFL